MLLLQNPNVLICTPNFTIGSSRGCNFPLKDQTISGNLCKIKHTQVHTSLGVCDCAKNGRIAFFFFRPQTLTLASDFFFFLLCCLLRCAWMFVRTCVLGLLLSFFFFFTVVWGKYRRICMCSMITVVSGNDQREGSAVAVLESTGSKGSVVVNGTLVKKSTSCVLNSGDEVVFGLIGNHSYVSFYTPCIRICCQSFLLLFFFLSKTGL